MVNGERVQINSREEWRAWLEDNHTRSDGIWLVRFKARKKEQYVAYDEVVEEALCYGWIDSLPRKLDENRTMLWMAPRKQASGWSKLNKERVERLISAGLMTSAGMEKVEAAKEDGSWDRLDEVEALEIPLDLGAALDAYDSARENFEAFPRSVRRGILEWILNAKKAQTRARRVEETARLAEENIRANQWRRR